MSNIFKYIREFHRKEVNFFYLLLVMAMLAILIYFNYWHGLEKRYAAGGKTKLSHFAGYYLLYFIPFAIAFLLQSIFYKGCRYFRKGWFWAILFMAPAFFSFRVNFDLHKQWVIENFAGADLDFYLHSFNWIVRVFVVLIPVYIVWLIKDRGVQPFYGTKALDNIKPYIIMLLVMAPLIALASTQKDFLHVYPKAKLLNSIPMRSWQEKWRYLIFELSYGFDFVSIEFFFRGFLILALINICGEHCIIPVACFYCTIHFGKPMGEAISSFFGGILLGIVSYNTRSIWGGLMVHVGIAWMMEIGGFFGSFFID
ncbi:MAG: family intrarane metalloprotease [Ferruginibacter sp.]|nr:family intrarane metalloprotease [Ferruginibacter sp.]